MIPLLFQNTNYDQNVLHLEGESIVPMSHVANACSVIDVLITHQNVFFFKISSNKKVSF